MVLRATLLAVICGVLPQLIPQCCLFPCISNLSGTSVLGNYTCEVATTSTPRICDNLSCAWQELRILPNTATGATSEAKIKESSYFEGKRIVCSSRYTPHAWAVRSIVSRADVRLAVYVPFGFVPCAVKQPRM